MADVVRWGVFLDLGRKRYRLRLVLDEVPTRIGPMAIQGALVQAGYGSRFSVEGVMWANHRVLREDKWPAELLAGGEKVTAMTWEALGEAQQGRRLSLVLEPADFAALELAAAQAGEKLYPWCRRTLLEGATGG